MRPCKAIINLSNLRHNLHLARQKAPRSKIFAVVKANAYGHGIKRVLPALSEADAFAVACSEEAVLLRDAGVEKPILLLEGCFSQDELILCQQQKFWTVIHDLSQLEMLERAKLNAPLRVWLKIDTGMQRLGFRPEQVESVWSRLNACDNAQSEPGLLTHFANADDLSSNSTVEQLQLWQQYTEHLSGERSSANSAAVLAWPESYFDWIRPGIMLYGISPLLTSGAAEHGLKPVMTLATRLIAIKQLQAGDQVGYGSTWRSDKAQKIGIAAIGYGDGYPRHAPSGTPVLVNGRTATLAGRVSMDMIAINLRLQPQAEVGDEVILWGQGLPAEVIAERAGTIAYELLCGVTQRVHIEVCA